MKFHVSACAFALASGIAALTASPAQAVPLLPDTGVVVRATGYASGQTQRLQVHVVNATRTPRADLSLRLILNGDSAEVADLAFAPVLAFHDDASGYGKPVDSGFFAEIRSARPRPLAAGCVKACAMAFDIPLGSAVLRPLESFRIHLAATKFTVAVPAAEPPAHALGAGDWSLAGVPLDRAADDADLLSGDIPPATHIQVRSGTERLWGIAPGEPEPVFPSPWRRDRKTHPWSAIANPIPDSLGQRHRDSLNLRLPRLLVNQAGYRAADVQAGRARIAGIGAIGSFSVIDASGAVRGTGTLVDRGFTDSGSIRVRASRWAGQVSGGDTRYQLASAMRSGAVSEGRLPAALPAGGPYRVVAGSDTSASFVVDDRVYSWLRDVELRFFGAQRSGATQSWLRGTSFPDDPAPGGWYDCGDHLKEGVSQSYAMAVLAVLAAAHPERDFDRTGYNHDESRITDGVPDLLRELEHGVDYVLGSWDRHGQSAATLVTSVGDFGKDHGGWFLSEWQDLLPVDRGGAGSRIGRAELGADVAGSFAAALTVWSNLRKTDQPARASKALAVARALYEDAKTHPARIFSSPSYYGGSGSDANLGLAAVALLWATGDTTYLRDLAYDTTLGKHGGTPEFWHGFDGGWLARSNPFFTKGQANLDWGHLHPLTLYAFARLVLKDSATAARLGVPSEAERRLLLERVVLNAGQSLASLSVGTDGIVLPAAPFGPNRIAAHPRWPTLFTQQVWGWNRYHAGNAAELALYAELAESVQGVHLPHAKDTVDWNAGETRDLSVRMLDFLLGVNPWGLSMVLGVGERNPQHPHHREANPEGRHVGIAYPYTTPDGALYGGHSLDGSGRTFAEHYNDYHHAEPCLDGSATLLIPAVLLSRSEGSVPVGVRRAVRPAFDLRVLPARSGVALRWAGAQGALQAIVVDARGRRVAGFRSTEAAGTAELALPPARGTLFLQVRDDAMRRAVAIPRL